MPVITIELIDSIQAMEALAGEWSELHALCPRATPFQSPQWLLPWCRRLLGGGDIWMVLVRDCGELVGLAPLYCWGIGVRRVSFLGAGVSDYGDLLFAPGWERERVSAVQDFLRDRRTEWNVLDLQELRSGSALLERWPSTQYSVCPLLDLRTYPDAVHPRHRTNLRHAHNRLASRTRVRFYRSCDIDAFFRLHEARWGTQAEPVRMFHAESAAAFRDSGMLRLWFLNVDGAPAAAAYSFVTGRTLYYYLTGYDSAVASLSPGALLLEWLIEQAMREGIEEVDFLRHPDPYNYLWGARDRPNYRIEAAA